MKRIVITTIALLIMSLCTACSSGSDKEPSEPISLEESYYQLIENQVQEVNLKTGTIKRIESENESVATAEIKKEGKAFEIRGNSKGKTKINLFDSSDNKVSIEIEVIDNSKAESLIITPPDMTLKVGARSSAMVMNGLIQEVTPSVDGIISFSLKPSKKEIEFTGLKAGECTVYIKSQDDLNGHIEIKVIEDTPAFSAERGYVGLKIGQSLEVKLLNGIGKKIEVSNDVALVEFNSQHDGVIINAKKNGNSVVTIFSQEDQVAKISVIVSENGGNTPFTVPSVLAQLAEYNIDPSGNAFAKDNDNMSSGFFTWDEAMKSFLNVNIEGKDYHLPTIREWQAIIPQMGLVYYKDESNITDDWPEEVAINGKTEKYLADYRNTSVGITYAIRFKGDGDFRKSAWRYEYLENPTNSQKYILKITERYLGPSFNKKINAVANESFWNSNNNEDVVRYLPCAGYQSIDKDGKIMINGSNKEGEYWTSTMYNKEDAYFVGIYNEYSYASAWFKKSSAFSIRLFKGKAQ